MEKKSLFAHFNWLVFISMGLLLVFGSMTILSTILKEDIRPFENEIFVSHLLNITIGFIFFTILSQIDYRLYYHLFIPIFIVTFIILLLVPIIGYTSHGSARWLDLGFRTFQPSEFAKLFFILFFAAFLVRFREVLPRLIYFFSSIGVTLIIAGLIFIQPDLGTSLVLLVVWFGMYYTAGMKLEEFLFLLISGAITLPFSWNFLQDYQKDRILVFLNPQNDPLGDGYSVLQSIIAVGSGQLLGLGWGRGLQSRLQFLPEHQTDFIFATLSEELGFIGVFLLVTLFVILFVGLLNVVKNKTDLYGRLVVIGIFCWFLFQVFVNIGMNIGIMPITGIPLPFISLGGSALIASMMALGIVQSVVKYSE